MKTKTKGAKAGVMAVILFYLLIALEFFYMASPFAIYFYSVYKPALMFLDNYPFLAGLTGFFMPHIVESTNSVILNNMTIVGVVVATIGLLLFILCASQVYYSKIFKRGVVTKGLYSVIRHPQYTSFAICSFGLLLIWPRYLSLFMFVSILFAYYILAKIEENECQRKFGDNYLEYKKGKGMFLPFNLNIFSKLEFSRTFKITSIAILYPLLLIISFVIAGEIKDYSISQLNTYDDNNNLFISVIDNNDNYFNKVINIIKKDSSVTGTYNKDMSYISYILPSDLYVSEIPMQKPENEQFHLTATNLQKDKFKIIITNPIISNPKPKMDKSYILSNTKSLIPLFEIWVDLRLSKVLKIIKLNSNDIRYKNISEPIF